MTTTPVGSYTDFLLSMKSHRISSPKDILNEVPRNTYIMRELLNSTPPKKMLRGSRAIQDDIMLDGTSTFRFYLPHPTFTPQDQDVLSTIAVGWRFAVTHYGYSDELIGLSEGDTEDVFVDYALSKKQAAATDMWEGMENAVWADPDFGGMESGTGLNPPAYSFLAMVNERTNGLAPGWTTKMGVNPALKNGRWTPSQVAYDAANWQDDETGLLAAMDEEFIRLQYKSPQAGSPYFEDDDIRKMKIYTNLRGVKRHKAAMRAGNDNYSPRNDTGYPTGHHSGVPIDYITALDTANADLTAGTPWAADRPRYLFLNLKYIYLCFHRMGYMQQVGPKDGGMHTPFSHAVFFRNWYNLFFRSMKRHGIVYPA